MQIHQVQFFLDKFLSLKQKISKKNIRTTPFSEKKPKIHPTTSEKKKKKLLLLRPPESDFLLTWKVQRSAEMNFQMCHHRIKDLTGHHHHRWCWHVEEGAPFFGIFWCHRVLFFGCMSLRHGAWLWRAMGPGIERGKMSRFFDVVLRRLDGIEHRGKMNGWFQNQSGSP